MLRALIILIALFFSVLTYAQDVSPFCYTIDNDSVMFANIKFEVNTDCILPNDFGIQHLREVMLPWAGAHISEIDSIVVIGTASPDGRLSRNIELAEMRCNKICDEFLTYVPMSLVRAYVISEDTQTLRRLISKQKEVTSERKLNVYHPAVRAAYVIIYLKRQEERYILSTHIFQEVEQKTSNYQEIIHDTIFITEQCTLKPLLGLKTNLLIDAIPYSSFGISFMPNIQAELYLNWCGLSVEFAYMFPWFKNDIKHKYFQIINGTIGVRKYFKEDYTGWYVGAYGNSGYYDLCMNADDGWQGEHWGFGVTAGKVFRLKHFKSIKIEPYVRIGYLHTDYDDYHAGRPYNNKYYYDWTGRPQDFIRRSHHRNWFGPTMIGINVTLDLYIKR